MKKVLKTVLSCLLAAFMTAASLGTAAAESENSLPETIQQGTVLHCFVWQFEDIRKELPRIAEAGFKAVQTSPFQLSFYGGEWSIYYSPFGFSLNDESALGTKEDLKALCEEADKYGIEVIVDVVANHLAPFREFWNGEYGYGEYLEDYEKFDKKYLDEKYWHNHGNIRSYYKRSEVTLGDMDRYLPDLNTENAEVQNDVKKMIAEYRELGVDGFRWDAAKHIALPSEGSDFWQNVIDSELYNYGEILGGPTNDNKSDDLMREYTDYMTVTDSAYGASLLSMFNNGKVSGTDGNWVNRGVNSDKLIYWAETHDTYCQGDSKGVTQNAVDRAYAVAASRQGASALYFSRPAERYGAAFTGEKGSTHFTAPEVAAVNRFHNIMGDRADCYSVSDNCAVVTREGGGAVLALGKGTGAVSVQNGKSYVPEGEYIDEISGNIFKVTSDTISGTIGESGIAVLYRQKEQPPTEASTIAESSSPAYASETAAAESSSAEPTTAVVFTEPSTQAATAAAGSERPVPSAPVSGSFVSTGEGNAQSAAALIPAALAAALTAYFFIRRKRE